MPLAAAPRFAVELLDTELRRLFAAYCSCGDVDNFTSLTAVKLSKLVKDAGMLGSTGGSLRSAQVDLAFKSVASRSVGHSQALPRRKHIPYPQFLEALLILASKQLPDAGCEALPKALRNHLLPLASKVCASNGFDACAGPAPPVITAAFDRHRAVLELVFIHYAKPPKPQPASSYRTAFWEELRRADALLPECDVLAGGDATSSPLERWAVVDQSAWLQLCTHVAIAPVLLSRVELLRVFQRHSHPTPPPKLTFNKFLDALAAVALMAFPSFGAADAASALLDSMAIGNSHELHRRLDLTGRAVGSVTGAIQRDRDRVKKGASLSPSNRLENGTSAPRPQKQRSPPPKRLPPSTHSPQPQHAESLPAPPPPSPRTAARGAQKCSAAVHAGKDDAEATEPLVPRKGDQQQEAPSHEETECEESESPTSAMNTPTKASHTSVTSTPLRARRQDFEVEERGDLWVDLSSQAATLDESVLACEEEEEKLAPTLGQKSQATVPVAKMARELARSAAVAAMRENEIALRLSESTGATVALASRLPAVVQDDEKCADECGDVCPQLLLQRDSSSLPRTRANRPTDPPSRITFVIAVFCVVVALLTAGWLTRATGASEAPPADDGADRPMPRHIVTGLGRTVAHHLAGAPRWLASAGLPTCNSLARSFCRHIRAPCALALSDCPRRQRRQRARSTTAPGAPRAEQYAHKPPVPRVGMGVLMQRGVRRLAAVLRWLAKVPLPKL